MNYQFGENWRVHIFLSFFFFSLSLFLSIGCGSLAKKMRELRVQITYMHTLHSRNEHMNIETEQPYFLITYVMCTLENKFDAPAPFIKNPNWITTKYYFFVSCALCTLCVHFGVHFEKASLKRMQVTWKERIQENQINSRSLSLSLPLGTQCQH